MTHYKMNNATNNNLEARKHESGAEPGTSGNMSEALMKARRGYSIATWRKLKYRA